MKAFLCPICRKTVPFLIEKEQKKTVCAVFPDGKVTEESKTVQNCVVECPLCKKEFRVPEKYVYYYKHPSAAFLVEVADRGSYFKLTPIGDYWINNLREVGDERRICRKGTKSSCCGVS